MVSASSSYSDSVSSNTSKKADSLSGERLYKLHSLVFKHPYERKGELSRNYLSPTHSIFRENCTWADSEANPCLETNKINVQYNLRINLEHSRQQED